MRDFSEFRSVRGDFEVLPFEDYHIGQSNDRRFHVGRVYLKPGARIPTQRHIHNSRHWTVVSGTADVQIGAHEKMVSECMSVSVPIGAFYTVRNSGLIPLEMVEVRMGCYLDDDDVEFEPHPTERENANSKD